jgi:hypothetical protein
VVSIIVVEKAPLPLLGVVGTSPVRGKDIAITSLESTMARDIISEVAFRLVARSN